MNLLHADAPATLLIAGWVIVLVALLQSAWTVRHRFLPTSATQHGWLAAIVAVSLLWALHVRSPVGLDFGLLGSALFAIVFGRARAVLGLMAAVALYTLMDDGTWRNVGVNGVVLARGAGLDRDRAAAADRAAPAEKSLRLHHRQRAVRHAALRPLVPAL